MSSISGTMHVQPITYRRRTVAACTGERFFLSDELERRPAGDRELVFVVFSAGRSSSSRESTRARSGARRRRHA